MPYINIRATKLDEEKEKLIVENVTHIIAEAFGKGANTIMVDIEKAESMYLGGHKIDVGAMIRVETFGVTTNDAKEAVNTKLMAFFDLNIEIPKVNIYVTFTDRKEWGYKGSFLLK